MARRKKRELSVSARRHNGPARVLAGLYDIVTQTSFLILLVIIGLHIINNAVSRHVITRDEAFHVRSVKILPEDDPDIQALRPLIDVREDDIFNDINLKAVEASLIAFSWIDEVNCRLGPQNAFLVEVLRKEPVARVVFVNESAGRASSSESLLDVHSNLFEPSSESYRQQLEALPRIIYYGEKPEAGSSSVPLHLRHAVGFVSSYSKLDIGERFHLNTVTYVANSFNIAIEGDISINIIDSNPEKYIPNILQALKKPEVALKLKDNFLYFDNHSVGLLKRKPEIPVLDLL